jgi:hypothetical protein
LREEIAHKFARSPAAARQALVVAVLPERRPENFGIGRHMMEHVMAIAGAVMSLVVVSATSFL